MTAADGRTAQESLLLSMKVRRCSYVLGGAAHLAQWCGVGRERLGRTPAAVARAIVDLEVIIARAQMTLDTAVIPACLHGGSALFECATPLEMIHRGCISGGLDAIAAEEAMVFT